MELNSSLEPEAKLQRVAEYDAWFREKVTASLKQLDRASFRHTRKSGYVLKRIAREDGFDHLGTVKIPRLTPGCYNPVRQGGDFGSSPEMWMLIQAAYDLKKAARDKKVMDRVARIVPIQSNL